MSKQSTRSVALATSPLEIEDTWVVYDRGPAMFPGLAYAANSVLLASFSTVPDGLPGGEIHLIRSYDHGHSWSRPSTVARSRQANGAVLNAIGLTALRNGTLLLPLNDVITDAGFINRNARLHILRSRDDGWSWEDSQALAVDIHEPFTYGQIVELPNGRLLCPIWGRWKANERWRSATLVSDNDGQTWHTGATIAYDPEARLLSDYMHSEINGFNQQGKFDPQAISQATFRPHSAVDGFSETSLIVLPSGQLLAILRQQGVEHTCELFFYRATSDDGGRTWSPYQRTNLCGMSPCLHRSTNGRLLLAYRNYAPDNLLGAEPGLSIAESTDNGATWQPLQRLAEPKGTLYSSEYQVGYPAMANTPDGRILVLYYSYDEALPHRRYLAANLLRETGSFE